MCEIDLSDVPMCELLAKIERRKNLKVLKLWAKREPLIFQCTTCGGQGNFFADRTRHGTIWHYPCTDRPNAKQVGRMIVIQGTFSEAV
jgi:hypothetical protein